MKIDPTHDPGIRGEPGIGLGLLSGIGLGLLSGIMLGLLSGIRAGTGYGRYNISNVHTSTVQTSF